MTGVQTCALPISAYKRDPSRNPIFQAYFTLQSFSDAMPNITGIECEMIPLPSQLDPSRGTTKFELAMELEEVGDEVRGRLEYCTALFESHTVETFARAYEFLSASASRDGASNMEARRISMQGEEQLNAIVRDWAVISSLSLKASITCQQGGTPERLLDKLFEAQVIKTPMSDALCFGDDPQWGPRWTYADVNDLAEVVSRILRELGAVGADTVIGVSMAHKPELIWTVIGILKVGAAWMPIQPGSPATRFESVVRQSRCNVIITDDTSWTEVALVKLPRCTVICAPLKSMPCVQSHATTPANRLEGSLAYVLSTSGSTGEPKLVGVEHGAVCRFMENWIREDRKSVV
mgnify:CR=1 FL=1